MEREDIPPIENAMHMNNAGGIGSDLATRTSADRRHHPHRGDHTTDPPLWTETETDSTVRETETEIYASETVTVTGIGI